MMATEKQIAANRKNARRSTGPRTGAGKIISAMNSTKHGLLGKFHLIEGEDEQEFAKFAEGSRAAFKPEGAVEKFYVDRWIKDTWLLDRLDNVVAALLVNQESPDDLSTIDLMNHFKFLLGEEDRRFGELFEFVKILNREEARNDVDRQARGENKSDASCAMETQSLKIAGELRLLEEIFLKHLCDRFSKTKPATKEARSTQTPAETDRAEDGRGSPSTEAAVNTMARAFSRNRGPVALALRYRNKIQQSRDNALHELQRLQAVRDGQNVAPPDVVDVNVNFTVEERLRAKLRNEANLGDFQVIKPARVPKNPQQPVNDLVEKLRAKLRNDNLSQISGSQAIRVPKVGSPEVFDLAT